MKKILYAIAAATVIAVAMINVNLNKYSHLSKIDLAGVEALAVESDGNKKKCGENYVITIEGGYKRENIKCASRSDGLDKCRDGWIDYSQTFSGSWVETLCQYCVTSCSLKYP